MKFTLTVSHEQLLILDRALSEMPYKAVAPLLEELNRQIKEQTTPQVVPNDDPQLPLPVPQPEAKAA